MSRFLASALVAAAAVAAPPAAPDPVHFDGPAMEKGILDATKASLYGDAKGTREALDRVEKGCRRVGYDDLRPWPRKMVDEDVALHAALDRAREYASRGMWTEAVDSMVWVERTCRNCHALRATTASPADSGNPSPPTGSTP